MADISIFLEVKCAVETGKVKNWAKSYLEKKVDSRKSLEIRVVNRAEISRANKRYLGKDGPTDVLSFPLKSIPGEKEEFVGSIVICNNVIVTQSKLHNVSVESEFKKMIEHGIDHLLGIHHS